MWIITNQMTQNNKSNLKLMINKTIVRWIVDAWKLARSVWSRGKSLRKPQTPTNQNMKKSDLLIHILKPESSRFKSVHISFKVFFGKLNKSWINVDFWYSIYLKHLDINKAAAFISDHFEVTNEFTAQRLERYKNQLEGS